MRVVTVCQNKGGEGKTTVSRLLTEFSARSGYRTLAIDMDPQCNFSQRFLQMDIDANEPDGVLPPLHPAFDPADKTWNGRSSIVDIYARPDVGAQPYPTIYDNLEFIPGYGPEMRRLELVNAEQVKAKILDRLSIVLDQEEVRSAYDVIIIDTAPSKSPLTVSAIRAATHILVPCQLETQSMEGLRGMIQLWRSENRLRSPENQLHMLGLLPNKYRPVALHKGNLEYLQRNRGLSPFLLPVMLTQRTAFAEADHPEAKPKSVFDLPRSDKARSEAIAACELVFSKLELTKKVGEAA